MTKTCPRCGNTFECMADNITRCHCASVILTQAQKNSISQKYNGCLCHKCLIALSNFNNQPSDRHVVED